MTNSESQEGTPLLQFFSETQEARRINSESSAKTQLGNGVGLTIDLSEAKKCRVIRLPMSVVQIGAILSILSNVLNFPHMNLLGEFPIPLYIIPGRSGSVFTYI